MSEPSGDPPVPPPSQAAARSPHAPEHLLPAPRANPPSVFNPKDALPTDAPPGLQDLLEWMKHAKSPELQEIDFDDGAQGRRTLPKEQKKFQRHDPQAAKAAAATAHGADAATDAEAARTAPKPSEVDPHSTASPAGNTRGAGRRQLHSPRTAVVLEHGPLFSFTMQLFVFVLTVASFLLGRSTVVKTPPTRSLPTGVPSTTETAASTEAGVDTLELINRAMSAETAGDFRHSFDLLQKARQQGTHVAGIDYHLALLAYECDDLAQVLPLLNRSIAAGEEVAASYNLRGTMSNRQGGVNRGVADLEVATRLDPFNPNYLYSLGEAQRRGGYYQAALDSLRLALDRQRDPNLASVYALKIRLTEIEMGRETNFVEQLAAKLAAARPSADWLFTAAALEMHRGDFAAAAGHLDQARERSDDETMNNRLRDPFFMNYAHEKSLGRFYSALAAASPATEPDVATSAQLQPAGAASPTLPHDL